MLFMLSVALMLPAAVFPQIITNTIQSLSACPGDTLVQVGVTNCNNVSAISLEIEFNAGVMQFEGFENINEALAPEYLFTNLVNNTIIFNWVTNGSPAFIGNDTLFQLRFHFDGGLGNISWNEINCEFADGNGIILQSYYFDGYISSSGLIPVINSHPNNVTIYETNNASFSVSTSGNGLNYQWQESTDGYVWYPLSNSGLYSGVHTNTLTLSNVPLEMNQVWYRCSISGVCQTEVISNSVLLTVNRLPIKTTLLTATTCPGNIAIPVNVEDFKDVAAITLSLLFNNDILTFSGYSDANPALTAGMFYVNTYQNKVFINWAGSTAIDIGDGALVKLLFTAIGGSSSFTWDEQTPGACEYGDIEGNKLPSQFVNNTITINQIPIINLQPQNVSVIAGQSATFSISATGTTIVYQWQVSTDNGITWSNVANGSGYSGATTTTLSQSSVTTAMNGLKFRCKVSGICPPEQFSSSAALSVSQPPQVIMVQAADVTTCPETVTVPVNTTNCNGIAAMTLVLDFNTSVMSFQNYQNLNPLLSNGMIFIDDYDGHVFINWASTASTNLGNGKIVDLVFLSTGGTGTTHWNNETPGYCEFADINGNVIQSQYDDGNVNVNYRPAVLTQPVSKEIFTGQSASFSITANGTGITYQWQVSHDNGGSWSNLSNNATYTGTTTATLNVLSATLEMSGKKYKCVVSGQCSPNAVSEQATLTVIPTPQVITASLETLTTCAGEFLVSVNVTGFANVSAFSLAIIFNSSTLQYLSCQNVNPVMSIENFIANADNGKVYINWVSNEPVTFGSGTLFKIKFTSSGGTSSLVWDNATAGGCEFSNENGQLISAN